MPLCTPPTPSRTAISFPSITRPTCPYRFSMTELPQLPAMPREQPPHLHTTEDLALYAAHPSPFRAASRDRSRVTPTAPCLRRDTPDSSPEISSTTAINHTSRSNFYTTSACHDQAAHTSGEKRPQACAESVYLLPLQTSPMLQHKTVPELSQTQHSSRVQGRRSETRKVYGASGPRWPCRQFGGHASGVGSVVFRAHVTEG